MFPFWHCCSVVCARLFPLCCSGSLCSRAFVLLVAPCVRWCLCAPSSMLGRSSGGWICVKARLARLEGEGAAAPSSRERSGPLEEASSRQRGQRGDVVRRPDAPRPCNRG